MATKFLRHSDEIANAMSDELYHYGVKGMKWHDHIYADRREYDQRLKDGRLHARVKEKERAERLKWKRRKRAERLESEARDAEYDEEQRQKETYETSRDNASRREQTRQNRAGKVKRLRKAFEEGLEAHRQEKAASLRRNASERAKQQARNEFVGRENAARESNRQSRDRNLRQQLNKSNPSANQKLAGELVRASNPAARRAHDNAIKQARAERRGREAALAEQERQARERRSELERQRDAKHARTTYADANDYAAYNARVQRHGEKRGREAALAEQERQTKERQARERRNRKRLSSAVSRNAQYYNKKR